MTSSSPPSSPPERRTTVTPGRRSHRTHRAGRTALVTIAALAIVVTGGLGIHSAVSHRAADQAVTELSAALATGLQAGDLSEVALFPADGEPEPTPQAELDAITAGLGGIAPTVTVRGIDVQSAGDREATATLTWLWHLDDSDRTWEYTTDVMLREDPTGAGETGWAAVWTPAVVEPSLADGEVLVAEEVAPELGSVQAADGTALAGAVPSTVIGLETEGMDAATIDASAVALTEVLELNVDNFRDRITGAPEGSFVPAMTIRDEQLGRFDTEAALAVPGAAERKTDLLLETDRFFAPGVIGAASWASANDAAASEGEVAEGEMIAESGVVAGTLDQLAGASGFRIVAGPAEVVQNPEEPLAADLPDGTRALFDTAVTPGAAVTTSLDPRLQDLAQDVVAETDTPSGLVAIRPSTGEVLAVGTGPEWSTYPRGLVGQYAPGSTFKVVSALGMLRSGSTPDAQVDCPESLTVEGFAFKNAESFDPGLVGPMTMTQAIAHSCNTALVGAAGDVSADTLAQSAQALGFAQENRTGHAEAYLGALPSDEDPLSHASDMIGQGTVLASPLTMATVAASVQQGAAVQPTLVTDPAPEPVTAPAAPLTDAEAEQLRGLMRAVVIDGTLDDLADVPGDPVHGKSGTAEAEVDGQRVLNSWTLAFQGDLAVAVVVEDGGYGSVAAAPIVEEFLRGAPAQE